MSALPEPLFSRCYLYAISYILYTTEYLYITMFSILGRIVGAMATQRPAARAADRLAVYVGLGLGLQYAIPISYMLLTSRASDLRAPSPSLCSPSINTRTRLQRESKWYSDTDICLAAPITTSSQVPQPVRRLSRRRSVAGTPHRPSSTYYASGPLPSVRYLSSSCILNT